jgi:hypothetical protein
LPFNVPENLTSESCNSAGHLPESQIGTYSIARTLIGWDRSHACESVTPLAMRVHAALVAVRVASSSLVPEATEQLVRPWKPMQTSTLNRRWLNIM